MKTILKSTALTLAFGFAVITACAASEAASLRIAKLDDGYKQVAVELSGFNGPVLVNLLDGTGYSLMEETVPAGAQFAKVLDLAALPVGTYTIAVSSERREIRQPLRITAADVILYEGQRVEYFAPALRLQERYLDLTWFNTRVANLELSILETDGTEVFNDNLRDIVRVERRYNLSNLRRGRYTVRVTTPFKTHFQTIELK